MTDVVCLGELLGMAQLFAAAWALLLELSQFSEVFWFVLQVTSAYFNFALLCYKKGWKK